jgi:hypothetical protein
LKIVKLQLAFENKVLKIFTTLIFFIKSKISIKLNMEAKHKR